MAGGIVGALFPGYFQWGLACGAVALICLLLAKDHRKIASGLILTIMLTITASSGFYHRTSRGRTEKRNPFFRDDPARSSPACSVQEITWDLSCRKPYGYRRRSQSW